VDFSSNREQLLSGSGDGVVRLWDLPSGKLVQVFEGHTDGVYHAVFDASQARILSGGRDRTIRLWDINTGRCLKVIEAHGYHVQCLAWHADQRRFLSCADDIRLWDAETGNCLQVFHGHGPTVRTVAWSHDHRQGHDFKVWKSDLYYFAQLIFREPGQQINAAKKKADASQPEKKAADEKAEPSQPAATNVNSDYPRIHPDLRVTFQLKAPDAKKVQVFTNFGLGTGGPWDMERNDDGVWAVTSPPVVPGFHYYALIVDGVRVNDPASDVFFGTGKPTSGIEIPEAGVDFYRTKEVPHGEVRSRWYNSRVTGKTRHILVYTPPSYDADAQKRAS
jgi:hypothetical protein